MPSLSELRTEYNNCSNNGSNKGGGAVAGTTREEITKHDVLSGRGGFVNSHPGNVRFRDLVHDLIPLYHAPTTRKLDKAKIGARIVSTVRNSNPPGRFLGEDATSQLWYEIGDERAIKKVGQAFRDVGGSPPPPTATNGRLNHGGGQQRRLNPTAENNDNGGGRPEDEPEEEPPSPSARQHPGHPARVSPQHQHGGGTGAETGSGSLLLLLPSFGGPEYNTPPSEFKVESTADGRRGEEEEGCQLSGGRSRYSPPTTVLGSDETRRAQQSSTNKRERGIEQIIDDVPPAKRVLLAAAPSEADRKNKKDLRRAMDMMYERARHWEDQYYREREYSRQLEDRVSCLIDAGGRRQQQSSTLERRVAGQAAHAV